MVLSIFNSEKRVFLTLSIIIIGGLIIAALNTILYFGNVHREVAEIEEKKFWIGKIKPSGKSEIVFLGDSRCLLAVNPAVFEKILNQKAFNGSFAAGGFNREIFEYAEEKLISSREGTKKMIVLGITSRSLTVEAQKNELFRITVSDSHREFSRWDEVSQILFSNVEARDLKNLIEKPPREIFYHKNGWLESVSGIRIKLQKGQLEFSKQFFRKAELSAENLEEILSRTEKWSRSGIYVFAFRPPTLPEMDEIEDTWKAFRFSEFVQEFEKKGGIWLEVKDRSRYQAYDGSHLNSKDAELFSAELAELIKSHLTAETSRQQP